MTEPTAPVIHVDITATAAFTLAGSIVQLGEPCQADIELAVDLVRRRRATFKRPMAGLKADQIEALPAGLRNALMAVAEPASV